jgi:hypothetical protein
MGEKQEIKNQEKEMKVIRIKREKIEVKHLVRTNHEGGGRNPKGSKN